MATKKKASESDDAGQAEVQETVDQLEEQGYYGDGIDPTPNENYTVDGVTSGKPTPETDAKQAAKAREASRAQ
jgi:hypothetical protein